MSRQDPSRGTVDAIVAARLKDVVRDGNRTLWRADLETCICSLIYRVAVDFRVRPLIGHRRGAFEFNAVTMSWADSDVHHDVVANDKRIPSNSVIPPRTGVDRILLRRLDIIALYEIARFQDDRRAIAVSDDVRPRQDVVDNP